MHENDSIFGHRRARSSPIEWKKPQQKALTLPNLEETVINATPPERMSPTTSPFISEDDDDTMNEASSSVHSSIYPETNNTLHRGGEELRATKPISPVVEDKGASIEVYGFICWICSFVAYSLYLLWAFIPEEFLIELGITYYPDKYWAIAGPIWFVYTIAMLPIVYVGLNFLLGSAKLDSIDAITDSHALEPKNTARAYQNEESIPTISDLPLDLVNQLIFPVVKAPKRFNAFDSARAREQALAALNLPPPKQVESTKVDKRESMKRVQSSPILKGLSLSSSALDLEPLLNDEKDEPASNLTNSNLETSNSSNSRVTGGRKRLAALAQLSLRRSMGSST